MALKDLRSLYDRHKRNTLGNTVAGPTGEGPIPSEGAYFSNNMTSDSPFNSVRGLKMDQMVQMLANTVKSSNTGSTYGPAPGGSENSPFQDMNGNDFGAGFANPLTGNYMGQYTNPDTGATF